MLTTRYLRAVRLFHPDVRRYLIASALNGFSRMGIQLLLLNLYLLRLGYGPEFIGLVTAVSTTAYTLFCLPAGVLGTRWGSRRMLITAVVLMLLGSLLLPLVEVAPLTWQAGWLLTGAVLGRLGLALYQVNGVPFLMSITGAEERGHAFAVEPALGLLAAFAGSVVGGAMPAAFGALLGVSVDDPAPFRYPLLIGAVLLVPSMLSLLSTRQVRAERSVERPAPSGRAPLGLMALMAVFVVLRYAGEAPLRTFFNVYLDVALGTSTALIASITAAIQLMSVLAALSVPLLVARWDKVRVIVLGALGIALCILPLALIPHWLAAGLGCMGLSILSWMTTVPLMIFSQEIVESVSECSA